VSFDTFKAANTAAPKAPELPKDWQPTVEVTGKTGKAVIPRQTALEGSEDAKERQLLTEAGFDPKHYIIAGDIGYRKWMRYDQEWLHYYKFNVTRLTSAGSELREMGIAELAKMIRKPKSLKPALSGNDAFVVVASDWQIGKGEGDGTPGTIQRVSDGIDQAVHRVKELRRIGRMMPQGAFLGTGDLVEGTCGFYSNQPYLIDQNDRQQGVTTHALLEYGIEELSPLFDDFVLATSLDNHGQKRQDGKLVTDLGDNKTAEMYDYVRKAFDRDARYGNLRWIIPNDETSVLLELGGVPVGLTHGDLFYGGGKLPQAKALEWWKGQDFGMQPLRGAQILMSGHFHHYSCILHGRRTHFQMPAQDPGSKWFKDSSGFDSPPGTFTVRLDSNLTYGWTDEAILVS
jgi:hypothetical protein